MLIKCFFKVNLLNISRALFFFPAFFIDCFLGFFCKDTVINNINKYKKINFSDDEMAKQIIKIDNFSFDISIIIPIYNVEQYLEECIESVLSQIDGVSVEVILIEDQSTDGSFELARKFSSYNNITLLQNKKNLGLSKSRNVGIENARGRYLFFLDSDDVLSTDSLTIASELINKYSPDIIQGSVIRFKDKFNYKVKSEQKKINFIDYSNSKLDYDLLDGFACGKFYKTALFSKQLFPVGIYFEDIIIKQLICPNTRNVIIANGIIYGYRYNTQSISFTFSKTNSNNIDEYKAILYLHAKLLENFPILSKLQKSLFYRECTKMLANRTRKVDYYLLKALMKNIYELLVVTDSNRKYNFFEKVNIFLLNHGMVYSFRVLYL